MGLVKRHNVWLVPHEALRSGRQAEELAGIPSSQCLDPALPHLLTLQVKELIDRGKDARGCSG